MNIIPTQVLPLTPTRTKVFITEREVMLGSAAALLSPPRETPHRRAVLARFAAIRRREPRRHYSRRDFTEQSRMAREMDRL
jgi:hypothetical protein